MSHAPFRPTRCTCGGWSCNGAPCPRHTVPTSRSTLHLSADSAPLGIGRERVVPRGESSEASERVRGSGGPPVHAMTASSSLPRRPVAAPAVINPVASPGRSRVARALRAGG